MITNVPNVIFKTRVRNEELGGPNPFEWKDVATADLFDNKNVVVFSLPGAFTPTCSTSHLPRYEALYEEFKAQGVDAVICVSVNDAFVMFQWGKSQNAKKRSGNVLIANRITNQLVRTFSRVGLPMITLVTA